MDEQTRWEISNTLYTIIVQRDETDSWRQFVMSILGAVYEEGYLEGWESDRS